MILTGNLTTDLLTITTYARYLYDSPNPESGVLTKFLQSVLFSDEDATFDRALRPCQYRIKAILKYGRPSLTPKASLASMKSLRATLSFAVLLVSGLALAAPKIEERATGGYIQNPSGTASFTMYSGCGSPACGISASGFTAAISQLAFGSTPGQGAGDACGRCFALTGSADPYSPAFTGPFHSVVVKVTDLCPLSGNQQWCGQTVSDQKNQFNEPVHFDLCEDTGASNAFFPSGHGALTGSFTEVSCSEWSGSEGSAEWTGACLSGQTASLWPSGVGCGNKGTAPS